MNKENIQHTNKDRTIYVSSIKNSRTGILGSMNTLVGYNEAYETMVFNVVDEQADFANPVCRLATDDYAEWVRNHEQMCDKYSATESLE